MNNMNNMTALYVYSPTTFKTNKAIETMSGSSHPPGEVQLQPGLYRVSGDAKLEAMNDPTASKHNMVVYDTKNGFPDPPLQATRMWSEVAIRNFFGGTGEANNI